MRVHPWMFWLCSLYYCLDFVLLYYCLAWYVCIYPYCLQWVLVIAILSTSLSACIVIMILTWLVLSTCIIDLYPCIVLLCLCISPTVSSEYRFYSLSPHPHVCLSSYFLAGWTIYLYIDFAYYYLFLVYCHCSWHWHLFLVICIDIYYLVICLLPQLLRAVAPALTLITSFQLRPRFASYGGLWWLLHCWMIMM